MARRRFGVGVIPLFGSAGITVVWIVAAALSAHPLEEGLCLALVQAPLSFVALWLIVRGDLTWGWSRGPTFVPVLALHVLIYYGVANVVPALFHGVRPYAPVMERIPQAPPLAYMVASLCALLFLAFACIGERLLATVFPQVRANRCARAGGRRYGWLPGHRAAVASCVSLLAATSVGTALFSLRFSAFLSDASAAGFSLGEQLLFHGVIHFLSIAPFLAAVALVQDTRPRRRQGARWLLLVAGVVTFGELMMWQERSAAMISLLLPAVLLVAAGRMKFGRAGVAVLGLVVVAYGAVTLVKISDLSTVVAVTDRSRLSVPGLLKAAAERSGGGTVKRRAFLDASYRTAGLEPAAAVIEAQDTGRLEPKWGKVIWSGFVQALPASLRPKTETSPSFKTAPAYYGVFQEGDWTASVLTEFIIDFGPYLLFIPALLAGIGLSAIDRVLLALGLRPALAGLLVLRIAWLLGIVMFEVSIADRTLLFFKATVGFAALLLLVGGLVDLSCRGKLFGSNAAHGEVPPA